MIPPRLPFLLLSSSLLLFSRAVLAQGEPDPTPPAPPSTAQEDTTSASADDGSPRAKRATTVENEDAPEEGHAGFAASFSIGYALPSGDSTGAGNDALSATFSGQVPLTVELGGNVTPSLFLGVYGTYAPGGLGGQVGDACNANQLSCSANSVHGGLAIRYRFLPGKTVEPWIGYAVGYETISLSSTSPQSSLSATGSLRGWEYGHFSLGVDLLAARQFAFGPFLDVSMAQYDHEYIEPANPNQPVIDADIPNRALHEWVTLGVRAVILP
jgi:hypothetical protein